MGRRKVDLKVQIPFGITAVSPPVRKDSFWVFQDNTGVGCPKLGEGGLSIRASTSGSRGAGVQVRPRAERVGRPRYPAGAQRSPAFLNVHDPFQGCETSGSWLTLNKSWMQDLFRVLIKLDLLLLVSWHNGLVREVEATPYVSCTLAGPDSHSPADSVGSEGAERLTGQGRRAGTHRWLRSPLSCEPPDNVQFTRGRWGRQYARERTRWAQMFQLSSPLLTSQTCVLGRVILSPWAAAPAAEMNREDPLVGLHTSSSSPVRDGVITANQREARRLLWTCLWSQLYTRSGKKPRSSDRETNGEINLKSCYFPSS